MFNDPDGIQLDIVIPKKTERELQRTLKKIDPKLKRKLSSHLRGGLNPIADKVAQGVPSQAPLSGMTGRWGAVSAKVRTFPAARPGRAIALINVSGDDRAFNRLLAITERAGSRTPGLTNVGRIMTSVLEDRYPLVGSGGRFVWKAWLKHRPQAVAIAIEGINKFVDTVNRRQ